MIGRKTTQPNRSLASTLFPTIVLVWAFLACAHEANAHGGVAPAPGTDVRMYRNPFQLEHEWPAYGIGDPFVLRWNGRYYLYPSTKTHGTGEVGVRVWVSENLVDWEYAGYASRDLVTYNAFAPEVVYWDGSFYMYQSANGQGHYVLKSDAPTGPFTAQTGNIGLGIDGSVFIDDDGSWYFTHAGHRGIRGYRMSDPYTVGTPRLLEADLGGWTEGPMILKRDGYYFMTYTGNHIRSAGYRVHYAVSENGPLGPYTEGKNNPLLLSTDDDFHGLGHNSLVLAPDLDGYMIVYHNIYNRLGAHIRKMNIDRLVFNGKKMEVLGPTTFPQVAPRLPDFYTWIDEDGLGDRWTLASWKGYDLLLSRGETESRFTAEFNFHLEKEARCPRASTPSPSVAIGASEPRSFASPRIGAVVSYRGGDFVAVTIDLCDETLSVWQVEKEEERLLGQSALPYSFDFTKLHTLRIAKEPGRMRVFFDQMLLIELATGPVSGGKIGYIYRDVEPVFRYTAYSNDAFGSSDRRVPKPVPGTIEAVHFGEEDSGSDSLRGHLSGQPQVIEAGDGTYAVALTQPGDALTYTINVAKDGLYAVDVVARAPVNDTILQWQVDSTTALASAFPEPWPGAGRSETQDRRGRWFKVPLGRLELKAGLHTLRLQLQRGSVELKQIDLYPVIEAPFSFVDALTHGISDAWREFGEGGWQSTEFGFQLTLPRDSMIIAGSTQWTDYFVQVQLDIDGRMGPGSASLLLRATHPSYYPEQVRDSVVAYAVTLRQDRILLQKLNYGSTVLASAVIDPGSAHTLAVEAKGPSLKVYLDDLETPILEYTDPDAWMHGAVGLRTNTTRVAFRNLRLHSLPDPHRDDTEARPKLKRSPSTLHNPAP